MSRAKYQHFSYINPTGNVKLTFKFKIDEFLAQNKLDFVRLMVVASQDLLAKTQEEMVTDNPPPLP